MVASLRKLAAKAVAERIVLEDRDFNLIHDLKDLVGREVTKLALIEKKAGLIEKNLKSLSTYAEEAKVKWKARKADVINLSNELIRIRVLLREGTLDPETMAELRDGRHYISMITEQEKLVQKSKAATQKFGKMIDTLKALCKKFRPEKGSETDRAIGAISDSVEEMLGDALDKIDKAQECAEQYESCLKSAQMLLEAVMKEARA